MKKLSLLLFALASFTVAQTSLNSNGWGDSCLIVGFNSTGQKYTKAFNLSNWENLRLDVMAMDTNNSKTTYNGAAIKFYWWVETGHMQPNYLGKNDTVWNVKDPLYVDTFDITTSGNMVTVPRILQTDGTYDTPFKTIDTLSILGYAVQSRSITPEWDEFIRVGIKGLSGNQTTTYVKTIVVMHRRAAVGVRGR